MESGTLIPKVSVLMSTYNGEGYLEEQINSIMCQQGCVVHLYVRDDGSDDSTLSILKKASSQYEHITFWHGNNIGYRKSFLSLLRRCETGDYYAYADQDDIWAENKLQKAISAISNNRKISNSKIILYTSSLELINEDGIKVGYNDITTSPNNIGSYFVRHRLAGCTMIFTKELRNLAVKELERGIPSRWVDHDFYIGSIAYAFGTVIRDKKSYIQHRRLTTSVTNGGKGILNRVKGELFLIFKRRDLHYKMAKWLLTSDHIMNKENAVILSEIANYKDDKVKLMKDKSLRSGMVLCDIEIWIKILLGNF